MTFKKIVFILTLFLFPLALWAQSPGGKKIETLDFGNELIQGDSTKPEFLYLLQKKEFNLNRLIKLRENFLPEMRNTSEVIKTR